ncbi:uncharacterized protein F4812DRAFT_458874 [Daldinia caldariorum]|uniref:uncharacterized protein n=1 Tax=Daldinia caldariorum TaxID=326644 RepID=UPI002007BBD8|nr:uncharacterized protein F4812DRAFT_458874 [Daldinia caldariorum]KAI1468440.1 hypothetical protein F4812DRAFT_458874 [Daldinia caldariorum]
MSSPPRTPHTFRQILPPFLTKFRPKKSVLRLGAVANFKAWRQAGTGPSILSVSWTSSPFYIVSAATLSSRGRFMWYGTGYLTDGTALDSKKHLLDLTGAANSLLWPQLEKPSIN